MTDYMLFSRGTSQLDKDKCEFSKKTFTFLGQVCASFNHNKSHCQNGGKFNSNLAECSQSLRELLSPKKSGVGPAQKQVFQKVKEDLTIVQCRPCTTQMLRQRSELMAPHVD